MAPLRLTDLEAGRAYRVRAVLPGYQEKEDLVTVGANEETVVPFALRLETGSVTLVSQPPGATVFIAGQDTGKVTPATLTGLPTGEEKLVTLKLEGYQDALTPVVAPPRGESITHTVTMGVAPGYGTHALREHPARRRGERRRQEGQRCRRAGSCSAAAPTSSSPGSPATSRSSGA